MFVSKRIPENSNSRQEQDLGLAKVSEQPVVIKQEPISETVEQLISVIKAEEPEVQGINSTADEDTAICVLCVRECPRNLVLNFMENHENNKQKLEQTIDVQLAPDNCQVCRTCWKLVEMFADFKESCLKAKSWMVRFSTGLKCDQEEDSWLSSHTLEVLERAHKIVQDHTNSFDFNQEIRGGEEQTSSSAIKSDMKRKFQLEAETSQNKTKPEKGTIHEDSSKYLTQPSCSTSDASEIDIFMCETCGRKIDGKMAFDLHRCVEGSPSLAYYSCSICSASFFNTTELNYHLNKHKGAQPYKCRKFCNNTFHSSTMRNKHCVGEEKSRENPREKLNCPVCNAELKNRHTLRQHINETHRPKTHPCKVCGDLFPSAVRAKNHMMRVHSEVRKYPCEVCDKAFKTRGDVRHHMLIHKKDGTRYVCQFCEFDFQYMSSLKRHIQRRHRADLSKSTKT